MAIVAFMLSSNFAFAEDPINIDINIDNENNITATGGNATAEQNQNQEQNQEQQQHQNMNFYERTQLPHLQYGTNFVTPGFTIGGVKWEMYCPADKKTLRRDQVERARTRVGFWASLFGRDGGLEVTALNERMSGNPESITCLGYWPENGLAAGAEVVMEVTGYGEYRQNLASLQADVANVCMNEAGTPFYAMMLGSDVDAVTNGKSISIGGATSAVSHNGNRGVVATGGGQLGTIKTIQQEKQKIWAKCITQGQVYFPPVVAPPPYVAPPKACNPESYINKIKESEKRIAKCWRYGHSNMVDRRNAARENLNAWICTKQIHYLREAIEHYQMAELNYIHGWDIKKYSDSDEIIAEVEYGLASAFYARDGHIENFWKAPKVVVHENKKTGKDKPVATTAYEKREILKIRHTLEKYSQQLTLD